MESRFVLKEPVERTANDFVLHLFALVTTDPLWFWMRAEIAVNQDGQISFEHSD